MLCNHNFIPSAIISDLYNKNTKVVLNKGWELIFSSDEKIEVFHEKHGTIMANRGENEPKFQFLIDIFSLHEVNLDKYINEIEKYSDKNELIELWSKGLFHVFFHKQESIKIENRYKWFFETLIRYSSSNLTPYSMFDNLGKARVAVVGMGGVGSSLAVLLSSHGINNLTLIDGDFIEESNLTRQIFFTYEDIGKSKVDVLGQHIRLNNPNANVNKVNSFINSYEDAENFIAGHDFVVLCADEPRFKIKAWVGKFCYSHNIPLLIMADKWIGPIIVPNKSPCYGCLGRHHTSRMENVKTALYLNKNELPPRASFGPEPIVVAGYFSSLVILYLSKIDQESYTHKRLKVNLFGMGQEERVSRYTDCVICGN